MTLPLPKTCKKICEFQILTTFMKPGTTFTHRTTSAEPKSVWTTVVPGSHTYPLRPKSKSSNITTAINYTSCCYHRNIVTLQWIHYTWNQCHQSNLQHFSPQNHSSEYSKMLLKQLASVSSSIFKPMSKQGLLDTKIPIEIWESNPWPDVFENFQIYNGNFNWEAIFYQTLDVTSGFNTLGNDRIHPCFSCLHSFCYGGHLLTYNRVSYTSS